MAARFSQIRLNLGENRAAVSVAVFSRFAIYANVVRRTVTPHWILTPHGILVQQIR